MIFCRQDLDFVFLRISSMGRRVVLNRNTIEREKEKII